MGQAPGADPGEEAYWFPFDTYIKLIETIDIELSSRGLGLELTSDDGFLSDYDRLLPWLVKTGRTASFFVPAGFIGEAGRLDGPKLREMHAVGMTIGCHGFDHLDWTTLGDDGLAHEIGAAKARLEDVLGVSVDRVAPPFGRYDAKAFRLLKRAGFSEIFSARGGWCVPVGRLRTRIMLQHDDRKIDALLALGRRGPGARDRLRCGVHEIQARVGVGHR